MDFKGERISQFIFGFFMVLSINLMIVKSLYFKINLAEIVILNTIIWFISFTIMNYHIYFKKFVSLLISLVLLFVFTLIPNSIITMVFFCNWQIADFLKHMSQIINSSGVIEFITWSYGYTLALLIEIPHGYKFIFSVIAFTGVSLLISFLIIMNKNKAFFLIPVLFFYVQWIRYVDAALQIFSIYAMSLILYYIMLNYKERFKEIKKNQLGYGYYSYKYTILFGTGLVIFIVLISNLFVNSFILRKINNQLSDIIPASLDLRSEYKKSQWEKRFYFGNTPYQPLGGRLGGSIKKDETLLMYVDSEKPQLYLRGRVKNVYTGFNWYSDNINFIEGKGNYLGNNSIKENELNLNEITIYLENMKTATIFAPYNPVKIEIKGARVYYNDDFEIYFKKKLFGRITNTYKVLYNLSVTEKPWKIADGDKEINKDRYLNIPDIVPQRIRALSRTITEGYNSDYEKMKALERYLRENYVYSLKVSNVPDDRDFVDYFLFDEKKGYCTYFASSLAVMGRSIGIPTRYVEGFLLPREKSSNGLFKVTGDRAHAWVEGYIEGFGWVRFEPTPAYAVIEEDILEEENKENDSFSPVNIRNNRDMERRLEELDNFSFGQGDYEVDSKNTNYSIVLIVVVLILMVSLLRILYVTYIRKKYFSSDERRVKAIRQFHSIIFLYSLIEEERCGNYTPKEFLESIRKNIKNIYIDDDIIDIVNKSIYSRETVTESDVKKLENVRINIEQVVVNKIGRLVFYYHKYFKGYL